MRLTANNGMNIHLKISKIGLFSVENIFSIFARLLSLTPSSRIIALDAL